MPPSQQPTRKQRLAEWRVQREAEKLQKALQQPQPPPPFRPTSSTASSTTRPLAASTSSSSSSISNISGSTSVQRQRLAERRRATMTAAAPSVKRTTSTSSSTGSASTARSPSRSPPRQPVSPPRAIGGGRGGGEQHGRIGHEHESSSLQEEGEQSIQLNLEESYYGVEYQEGQRLEDESSDSLSVSSGASSPRPHEDIDEEFRAKMKESDLESEQLVTMQRSAVAESDELDNAEQEEATVVSEVVVSVTTAETTQVVEEFYAEPDEIKPSEAEEVVEATISQTTEVSSETHAFHDEAEAFAYVRGEGGEEDQVSEQHTVVTRSIEVGAEGDANTEEEVVVVETTTTTTTTTVSESVDETPPSSAPPGLSQESEQSRATCEQLMLEEAQARKIEQQRQARLIKMLVVVSVLPLLALVWPAVCWFFPSSKCAELSQMIPQMEAAKWKELSSRFKTFSSGFLSKIGNPERYISQASSYCSSKWDDTWSKLTASPSLSKAKTLLSDSSEKLHSFMSAMYNGSCSAFSTAANACASVWERVLPAGTKGTSLVESMRESLLEPFEVDQQLLNEELKTLLLQQEAWALEELKRMKQRRVAHASVTDSVLSDTRTMVMQSLKEAKLVATYHIEAYTEAISDELIQSIQRELNEYDQRVREEGLKQVEAAVEHEQRELEAKTQEELESLEQLKLRTDQELDKELDVDAHQVVSAKAKLVQELAEVAEFEKQKIEGEYQKAADAVSKLVEAETDLLEANLEVVENEVVDLSMKEEEWIREEDTKLLDELELLAKLEGMRIAAEKERALAEVAQVAEQEAERIRQEREQAEALARALEAEEQRLVAERQRVEARIAEAARRDYIRLEEERKSAAEAILEAQEREHERIRSEALKAEEELLEIKRQEEERAEMERAKAEAAIAEAALAEEERLRRERDAIEAELALEAGLEQERLREERVEAEKALEQALEEDASELLRAQQEESEELFKEAAEEVEKVIAVEPIDVAAVVGSGGGIKIAIVAETEVQVLFPGEGETVAIAADPQNGSSASMLPLSPPIPKMELYKLGLVSTAFLVLGLVSAWFLSARYRRLVARRRQQRAHGFKARRKRWQRPVESSDSEFAEEVVLLSSANGNEPEPEVVGYSSDAYTVSEDLSQTSSLEELDEVTLISTTTTTLRSQTVTAFADEIEEDEVASGQYFAEESVTVERTTTENEEGEDEDDAQSAQSRNGSPSRITRRSRRTATASSRRATDAFSP